jgi:hypothetical protein
LSPFYRAEFGGPFSAPEFTDERGRNKMMGSVIFYEAESIEEVRRVVESVPYYTDGVVSESFLFLDHPTTDPDPFGVVGQRESRNSPFCAIGTVAVEVGGTAQHIGL